MTGLVTLPPIPARLAERVRRVLIREALTDLAANGGSVPAELRTLLYALDAAVPAEPQPPMSPERPTPAAPATLEISTVEAAGLGGCSPRHVQRLCRSGRILARRIGRAWLVDRASWDAWRHGEGRAR